MISFLFWNLNRKPLQTVISKIASQREVDVIILTECYIPSDALLRALNYSDTSEYYYPPGLCQGVRIFTRFPEQYILPKFEDSRTTIRHIKLPGATDILLVAAHLPSKLHWRDSSQVAECTVLANMIRTVEKEVGHSRTVLIGDLNTNPFEPGVVNANGLHGVMSRHIAEKRQRKVQGRNYPFFYNPMWSLLGDASPGPPGTYFQSRAEHTVFFWNTFDQLMIRPELLRFFNNEDLEILQSDGTISFLSRNGLPDGKLVSDHLPVYFKLRL